MNSELSQQQLLGNDSPNLTQEQNPADVPTARDLLDGDTPSIHRRADSNDQKTSEPEQLGAVNEEGDSPTVEMASKSPGDDIEEDDGKMLQEEDHNQDHHDQELKETEGRNLVEEEEPQDEPIVQTADLPTKKDNNKEATSGLIQVKPTPRKQKRFATVRSFYSKVAKLRSMNSFWEKEAANVNMKKEMRDHYVNVADLLPEGIESAADLQKLYEDKRSMKKIRHLSSFPKAHEDEVLCLIFTPDRKFIVSGSNDRTIKIWDVNTKRQLYHFKDAHEDGVRKLAMTSDSKYLISGSMDNSAKMWDFSTRQLIHHFKDAHKERVSGIAITSDNKYMVTCSWDKSIKIFDLNTKEQIAHLEDVHIDMIRAIQVTSDNKYIISGSADGTVKLFDFYTRQKIFTFEDLHSSEILTMALTPDNQFIVTGSADQTIKILDIEDRKEIHCWNEGIDDQVGEVAISSDGQYLFAGIADGSMLMLEMDSKKLAKHFKDVHQDRFYGLAVSEYMDFTISCSSDKSIEVTEIEEKKKMFGYLKKAHTSALAAVAFTSDSQHFISGADDLSIKMFDVKTKKLVHTWSNAQGDKIASLCVTPNNKYLVSGSWDRSIKIIDLETKEDYHTFPNVLTNVIRQIAISSDGKYVVACGDDRALRLYDIEEKKEVHHIPEAHDAAIYGVAITPDNNYIISCSGDKSIKIFDLDSKELVYKFKEAHNDEVFAVVVTPNNKYIVSASRDFSIKIFELETKQLVHTFVHAHDNSIFALTVSSDSRFVASGSADESVRVFDLECREMVCHFQNIQNEWIWAVAFSPNNKYLASGAGDGSVKVIDFETDLEEHHFDSPLGGSSVYSVAVSPNGEMMAAGSGGGEVAIFDMKTKERLCMFSYAHSRATKAVAWTPDSKFVVSGSADTHICVFDVEKQEEVDGVRFAHREMIYAIAVTPDGKYIVSGSKDRSIKVIEFANREVYHHFKEIHEETIRSVAVTPDSKYIISASTDKSIKVLDIEKKQLVYHFRGAHPRWIKSVSASSDGRLIASCSDDRSIKLFDLQTKQLVHWFKNAHDDFIEAVAISNDCRYIISGSRDKSVRIFDIQTKQQIQQFKNVHHDRVRAVALTPDNQFIISSSVGGSIKILRMSPIALPSSQATTTVNESLLTTSGIQLGASEIYYVYNGFAKYSNFNAVDDFLFNTNIPIKTINASLERCQRLTVLPFGWNILHIAAIRAQHSFIKHMPEYSQFKVPFLLDAAGKTPLHYLIAHDKLNSNSMNVMLTYICDFVDGLHKHQHFQAQEILISLTPLFWLILAKTEIKIRERFLNICFISPPLPYNYELPIFGSPAANVGYFHPSLGSIYHSINSIWTKGDDTIDFRTNIINIDYNVLSDDMTKTIKVLRRQANEEVFKTGLIIKLIDHLWDQSRNILLLRFGIFSAFIIALSVYLSLGANYQAFDIVILVGAGYFLFSEFLQVVNLKLDYALDPWNWLDSAHFGLALAFAIDRLTYGYRDNITMAWIATVIIMTGYLRWISYLKIFKPTRNLIQVIVAILSDMKSFIIIIAMIIIGFSFIFLFFNKGALWGFYLMDSYGSMYGPIDGEDPNFSQKLLICFISFLLNVVLLNLLISIMGDSYERVLEKRVKTDSLTRLEMIAEATTHMKYWSLLFSFILSKKTTEKGYLIFCLAPDAVDDDEAENDWEGKIHIFRKIIKGSETSTEKRIMTLENEMNRKFEKSRKEQLELHEKTNEILKLLKDIKNHQTASQPK